MALYSPESQPVLLEASTQVKKAAPLPTLLRRSDLVLFVLLCTVSVPYISAVQVAGKAAFAYWGMALLTFLLPCIVVSGWLTRHAPAHVPVYSWILRLVDARWRSFLLFLIWWVGVLAVISILGQCLSWLRELFPALFSSFWPQCGVFVALLICATALVSLPARILVRIISFCALLYLAFFLLLGCAMAIWLMRSHLSPTGPPLHPLLAGQSGSFALPVFGLTLFSLLGVNLPLFLDGQMQGSHSSLRHSSSYLWWGGLLSFVALVIGTAAVMAVMPTSIAVQRDSPLLALDLVFGPLAGNLGRFLLLLGHYGMVLAYLLVFSRALLLAARYKCLSPYFVHLNRAGSPQRMLLLQFMVIMGSSLLLLIIAPFVLKEFVPVPLVNALVTDDPFCLFVSISGSLWAFITALLFLFACWIFFKKQHHETRRGLKKVAFPTLCLVGFLGSLTCSLAPSMNGWATFFLAQNHWFPEVLVGAGCSLFLAWLVSELPRRSVLLSEQRRISAREQALRKKLQHAYEVQRQAYDREHHLHNKLQTAYEEQQISILQQKLLLRELNRLYREQERAAITDPVTGLPNHRAFIQRMDEEIAHCQREQANCLVFFIDLDHFKDINDNWGHLAGDAVLCEVARRLRLTLREGDFVSRYGGEEFALIMEKREITEATETANHLCQVIRSAPCKWRCAGEEMVGISVTASIGVAAYGVHGTQREELIEQADLAMYQAKLDGRNCIRVADAQQPLLELHSKGSVQDISCCDRKFRYLSRDNEGSQVVSAQALQALCAVIHISDHLTSLHSQRLIGLAMETSRRMGASCEELFLIRLGGLLHDLGKIVVPAEIRNKTGPLDAGEWEQMRMHPMIGARILEEIGGVFAQLSPIVMSHHEHWDGTGYPRGLRAQEIPFAARILSVADAYDAMVSRRVYKAPVSPGEARAELCRCSGTQFDPAIVEAFLNVLKDVDAEQEEFYQRQLRPPFIYKSRAVFQQCGQ